MPVEQVSRFCSYCQRDVLATREVASKTVTQLQVILTLGLWLIPLGIVYLARLILSACGWKFHRCTVCGHKV